MAYDMIGTVKLVKETQTFNSGFTKREFVITTEDDRYPQEVAFACIKDDCALLDGVQAGERLRVNFNIRGREYQGRHFVNLECYKFERLDAAAAGGDVDVIPEDEPPLDDSMPF
jgi:single-strand DNA-binding protein